MNTVRRIAKNTLVLLVAQIVSMGLGFFYVMYTARYLGAEGFGVLSFALAFTGMFGVLTDIGLQTLATREISRDKSLAGKYLGNVAIMKTILVVITFCLIALSINLLAYPERMIIVVYFIAASVIISSFSQLYYSIFQAFERMEYQSVGQILSSVLMFFGILFAINREYSVIEFAFIYFLVSTIILIYNFVICTWKFVKPKIEIDLNFWKITLKEAIPFGLTNIFIVIYYYIDTVMISMMIPNGNEVVGWYNAAYRLILVLLFIPTVYITAVFPMMSKFHSTSKDSLKFIFEKSLKYMLIMGVPIVIGVTLLSDRIILLFFGSDYAPSIIALQILVWSFLFASLGAVFGYLLNSINKQMILTKIVGVGATLNIILNLILIPTYSYLGASIATDFTRLFVILVELIILSKIGFSIKSICLPNILAKIAVSSFMMGSVIILLGDMNIFYVIIISAISYFVGLFFLRIFDKEDLLLFKSINIFS